jgi:hypothetical protein
VRVSIRLDHPERQYDLLVTGFEAELGFEFVRFGGRSGANERVGVADGWGHLAFRDPEDYPTLAAEIL